MCVCVCVWLCVYTFINLHMHLPAALLPSQPDASASAGADTSSGDKMDYLRKHDVAAKLHAAVNELADAKPDDPIAWLAERLAKLQ